MAKNHARCDQLGRYWPCLPAGMIKMAQGWYGRTIIDNIVELMDAYENWTVDCPDAHCADAVHACGIAIRANYALHNGDMIIDTPYGRINPGWRDRRRIFRAWRHLHGRVTYAEKAVEANAFVASSPKSKPRGRGGKQ